MPGVFRLLLWNNSEQVKRKHGLTSVLPKSTLLPVKLSFLWHHGFGVNRICDESITSIVNSARYQLENHRLQWHNFSHSPFTSDSGKEKVKVARFRDVGCYIEAWFSVREMEPGKHLTALETLQWCLRQSHHKLHLIFFGEDLLIKSAVGPKPNDEVRMFHYDCGKVTVELELVESEDNTRIAISQGHFSDSSRMRLHIPLVKKTMPLEVHHVVIQKMMDILDSTSKPAYG